MTCWPDVPFCAGRLDADRAFLRVGPANAGGIVAVGCRRLLRLCAHQLPSSVRAGHLGGVFTWLFSAFCTDSVRVSPVGVHKMCAHAPIISCTCMCHPRGRQTAMKTALRKGNDLRFHARNERAASCTARRETRVTRSSGCSSTKWVNRGRAMITRAQM